jgi:methionyl-tRNA formyltransferase
MNLVFAGSSQFAVPSLDALVEAGHGVLAVLTQPDRPAGRRRRPTPTPVKVYAQARGMSVIEPPTLRDAAVVTLLKQLVPEIMVVVDYGLIIPRDVLEVPARGCINGHASLLPRWRGAAPIERAVLAGDRRTGITVMQMDEGLDTGPVLLVRPTPIGPQESAGELRSRLALICADALTEALEELDQGRLHPEPQVQEGACYAAKLETHEARIDWEESAVEVARRVRAFNPRPGAFTTVGDQRLKVLEAVTLSEDAPYEPGQVFRAGPDGIDVGTGEGVLRMRVVQVPGGRPMSCAAYLNGHRILGERLGGGSP